MTSRKYMRKFRRRLRPLRLVRSNRVADRARSYGVGVAAAIAAAGAAFFFDPQSGGRRRALLRDQFDRTTHRSREFIGKASRDARQRIRGSYAELLSRYRNRGQVDDRVVEQRVRAALGRLTAHAGAIEAVCRNGIVRLTGDVLQEDADRVLRGVARVRGVGDVVNEVRVRESAERISALQGGSPRQSSLRSEFGQINWSPAPRVLAGAGGVAMAIAGTIAGIGRRTPLGYGMALGGAALLARSIRNKPLSHVARRRADVASVN
jgi:osmotically-inducible protein OsmY